MNLCCLLLRSALVSNVVCFGANPADYEYCVGRWVVPFYCVVVIYAAGVYVYIWCPFIMPHNNKFSYKYYFHV